MMPSTRNLEEMAVFAKVGDLESISGAARALGLPKSTVSRAVARLEAAYKARLVERTTRKVALTEIGRALHAHCRRMVSEVDNAEAEIAAYQGHPSGRLTVASPAVIGYAVLRPHLARFLDLYPDIDLQLQLTDRLLNPVTDGFDVVIRIGPLEDSLQVARKIVDIKAVLVASPNYIAAFGLPTRIEDLADHRVIGMPRAAARSTELRRGQERVTISTWDRFASNDPILNLEIALAGQAIAPVSWHIAAGLLERGALLQVLPDFELVHQPQVHALYAGRTALSPKIAVFLDFLGDVADRIYQDPALLQLGDVSRGNC